MKIESKKEKQDIEIKRNEKYLNLACVTQSIKKQSTLNEENIVAKNEKEQIFLFCFLFRSKNI